ncbi:hypothetical protein [Prolixibacter denitrificans]|uniref:Uncharacterized protein n=1 Tax=Prolixibacter denitrificans TaxID=1541063 RepID=A0A2P8CEE6_9BACT|nr:hypothetical protein [Prolixibacter denitrificans]PSK83259.1 hypothetical protein CLV93_104189 [Prolixibacter denitrificans]GET21858.1 hypothetical protein JCM18694_21040 [Prolixibacter denitrificans]
MTLENLSYIAVILGTFATGSYFLFRSYRDKQKYYRRKLHDNWLNEGDITLSKFETHYVFLELEIELDSGEIVGIINSRNKKTDSEMRNVSVNGKLRLRKGKIKLSNIERQGQQIDYGKLKIKLDKYGNSLTIKNISKNYIYLPFKTTLRREGKKTLETHN